MISSLEYQKSKEKDHLKDYEPETLTCKCHMESEEMSCSVIQQQKSTSWENCWVVANSGPVALNFSHLQGWVFDQKEDFFKKEKINCRPRRNHLPPGWQTSTSLKFQPLLRVEVSMSDATLPATTLSSINNNLTWPCFNKSLPFCQFLRKPFYLRNGLLPNSWIIEWRQLSLYIYSGEFF